MLNNDVLLAWCAGVFEAEGTIAIVRPRGNNLGYLRCHAANTDVTLLQPFLDAWGGEIHSYQAKGNRKPHLTWSVTANNAAAFLRHLRPQLRTQRKQNLADMALVYQQQKHPQGKNASPEYRAQQWTFYHQFQQLNMRGLVAGQEDRVFVPEPVTRPTTRECAWAAGMFSGEGSVMITGATGTSYGVLKCTVINTDPSIVAFFLARWGGRYTHVRAARYGAQERARHLWIVSNRMCVPFLEAIAPFIHIGRQQQRLALALEYQAQKRRVGRHTPSGYREQQQRYHERMQQLNKRGKIDDTEHITSAD